MSQKPRKMLNAAINTDALLLEAEMEDVVVTKPLRPRLKERSVRHVKVSNSAILHEAYNFREQIGKGGFGTVVSVTDRTTNKEWAMKIVLKATGSDRMLTIQREIQILKMVEHPHIIYLDRVYESNSKIYLVIERCYGALSAIYKAKKPFSEDDTRKVIRDLTSAVAYLHKNDIVHRDLKLENILTAKNPDDAEDELYIKVTDFGLSIIKQGSGHKDMLHDVCGTLIYMAPEVITYHSYSHQCDVWAIGVIMYTLLGGRFPFYSDRGEQELASLICKAKPSYSGFSASDEALHLMTKMLAKNPALRITAAEMVHHPWMLGKAMVQGVDSPENVLDMMHLWRSEMMLPVGEECDWVSSARASTAGSSTIVAPVPKPAKYASSKLRDKAKDKTLKSVLKPDNPDESTSSGDTTPRRESLQLPIKNIRFERAMYNTTGSFGASRALERRATGSDNSERLQTDGRDSSPPDPHAPERRLSTKGRAMRRPSNNSKPSTPQTSDRERKRSVAK